MRMVPPSGRRVNGFWGAIVASFADSVGVPGLEDCSSSAAAENAKGSPLVVAGEPLPCVVCSAETSGGVAGCAVPIRAARRAGQSIPIRGCRGMRG